MFGKPTLEGIFPQSKAPAVYRPTGVAGKSVVRPATPAALAVYRPAKPAASPIQLKVAPPPKYRPMLAGLPVPLRMPAPLAYRPVVAPGNATPPAAFCPAGGGGKSLVQRATAAAAPAVYRPVKPATSPAQLKTSAPSVFRPVCGGKPITPACSTAQAGARMLQSSRAASQGVTAPPVYRPVELATSSVQAKRSGSAKKRQSQPSTFRYKDTRTGEVFPTPTVDNSSVDWVSGRDKEFDKTYEQNLFSAAKLLKKKVEFGSSSTKRKYDPSIWSLGQDKDGDEILILRPGRIPSVAVTSMFNSLSNLSLDCIEYIQVARWYAQLQSLGAEEFDRRAGTGFKLSYHETSGLGSRTTYLRNSRREPFRSVDALTNRSVTTNITLRTPQEEDQFLAELPIGTRVMWSDGNPESQDSDFENENTIKVSANRFAAHPFGIKTAAEIREEMASEDADKPSKVQAYIRRWVYIKEIEWYARV